MSSFRRIVWAVTLCTFVSGCASVYRPVGLPGEAQEKTNVDQVDTLNEGDKVRVTMISGDEISGNFVEISSEVLTLDWNTIKGKQKREIVISEIEKVEIKEGTEKLTAGMVVGVVLMVAICASIYAAASVDVSFGN